MGLDHNMIARVLGSEYRPVVGELAELRARLAAVENALRLLMDNTDSHTGHMDGILRQCYSALAAPADDAGEVKP